MSNKAFQHPTASRLAILPNGRSVTTEQAEIEGFTIVARDTGAWSTWADTYIDGDANASPSARIARAQKAKERERSDYIGSILALPEALSRPIAAAKLAALYSDKSMPVAKAAIFLRSLPTEDGARVTINELEPSMSHAIPAHTDAATFRRKIELRFAAMAQRADHGDLGAKAEAKRLGYAVKLINSTNMNPIAALQSAGVEPATIR